MALEAFRRIQIGLETTQGTKVAATKKAIGTLTMTPEIDFHRPVDERNSLAEFRRDVITGQRAALKYEGSPSYEQIIDWLLASIRGVDSSGWSNPTTPGGGTNSRDWTFSPLLTGRNQQDSYTIEYGDDTQEFEVGFAQISQLELAFAWNEVIMMTADMYSTFPAKSSFTGALSDPSVTEIVANHAKFYIDGTWANRGSTEKATLLAGATWRLNTGLVPIKYADGTLEISSFMEQRRHLELDLDMAVGAAGMTEYDAAVAGTDRAIRIDVIGAVIEAAITYKLRLDTFGRYEQAPEIFGVRDGENLFNLKLLSYEEGASNKEFEVIVTNTENALS